MFSNRRPTAAIQVALAAVAALFSGAACSSGEAGGPAGSATAPEAGSDAACDRYCRAVMVNCTGEQAQYASAPDCSRECRLLSTSANSVECRTTAALAAAGEPATRCAAAGPYGGGVCGDRCDAFCAIALGVCSTGAGGPWRSAADCADDCAGFAFDPAVGDAHQGPDPGPTAGHDLSCREYHLQAAVSLPVPHCTHIGPVPATAEALAFPCK